MDDWICPQVLLITVGLALDITGVILLSAEDLHPAWLRVRRQQQRAVRAAGRAVQAIVARVSRRAGHVYEKTGTVSAGVSIGGSVRGRTHAAPTASDKEKIAYLLAEAERTQERIDNLEGAIRSERNQRTAALEQIQKQVARLIDESISASRRRFAVLRRVGVAFVVAGSALLAAANTLSC